MLDGLAAAQCLGSWNDSFWRETAPTLWEQVQTALPETFSDGLKRTQRLNLNRNGRHSRRVRCPSGRADARLGRVAEVRVNDELREDKDENRRPEQVAVIVDKRAT